MMDAKVRAHNKRFGIEVDDVEAVESFPLGSKSSVGDLDIRHTSKDSLISLGHASQNSMPPKSTDGAAQLDELSKPGTAKSDEMTDSRKSSQKLKHNEFIERRQPAAPSFATRGKKR